MQHFHECTLAADIEVRKDKVIPDLDPAKLLLTTKYYAARNTLP